VGGVVVVPVLAWAIDPARFGDDGWRNAAVVIGLGVLLLAFPISRLIRNKPEDYGVLPDGAPPGAVVSSAANEGLRADSGANRGFEYTWRQAVRTQSFWLITMGHACTSIVIVTLMVHLGSMLTDQGFSLQTVGWVVATQTGVAAVFNMVGGYVGDRAPLRLTLFGFSALQTVAVVILLFAHTAPMVYLFAVVFGIGFGGRTPLTTSIRGLYFGRKSFASITGVSMIPMNLLHLTFPLFTGIVFDATGSYDIPFAALAVVSFIGALLFLMLGEPAPLGEKM